MRNASVLFILTIILFLVSTGLMCSMIQRSSDDHATSDIPRLDSRPACMKAMKDSDFKEFRVWNIGQGENERLFYLIEKVNVGGKDTTDMEALRVYDNTCEMIFEAKANYFSGVEAIDMLRQPKRQLVIKSVSYGGSGRFFQILDYQNGKVVALTDDDEGSLYSGEAHIFPRYDDSKYISAPFQVFLGQYVASPNAHVLRYVDGKYRVVGELDLSEVGKFINGKILRSPQ